jgi:hypothetical protein
LSSQALKKPSHLVSILRLRNHPRAAPTVSLSCPRGFRSHPQDPGGYFLHRVRFLLPRFSRSHCRAFSFTSILFSAFLKGTPVFPTCPPHPPCPKARHYRFTIHWPPTQLVRIWLPARV